jgi:hypothetical protein
LRAGADPGEAARRRAERLLRWYPRAWRGRYGAEFAELLISDIAERPQAPARTLDVVRGGIIARLAGLGLCGVPVTGPGQDPAAVNLACAGCCQAVFLLVGAAMWSQVAIGWQWAAPASTATMTGMLLMSAALLAFTAVIIAAALLYAWAVAVRLARGRGGALILPALAVTVGATIAFVGGRHFGNGWPGTGGHPWPGGYLRLGGHEWIGRGLVPGGLAAFSWASTLSVTTYWLHPAALASFPAAELAWMAASPLALASASGGAALLVRRVALPPRLLACQARLATSACGAMLAFFAGCGCWVAGGGQGLFRAGAIDAAGVAVLAVTLAVAAQAARRARYGTR